jgi:chemotaxis protein MotB
MKKKPGAGEKVNHERWLISYADFITLLFAFFVVLYASSRADQTKAHVMAQAIQSAFTQLGMFPPASATAQLNAPPGPPAPDPAILRDRQSLQALREQLAQELAPEIQRHAVALQLSHQGLVIRLQELGFFDSGSDQLRPESLPVVGQIAAAVRNLPNPVRIEGYTDDVPIHNQRFASNWELSTARAASLVELFIGQEGVAPARMSAAGYGEYHPLASNGTLAGRQRNRRVDVVVVSLEASRALAPEGGLGAAASAAAAAPGSAEKAPGPH